MNDGASVPGGYLLHTPAARTLAARVATAHTLVIGVVIALVAIDTNQWDAVTTIFLVLLCIWALLIPLIPWRNVSHNYAAKLYFLGAGSFVFFAFHFDNPYLLLGIYPEMFAFADIYWYRRSMVALHIGMLLAAFVAGVLIIGGSAAAAMILLAAPLMVGSALLLGAMSHRFIQSVLQHSQFESAVSSLLEALQARDGYTGEHSRETLAMATAVADELDLDLDARKELADVALLHDIGKIGIPNSILQKPGALTDEEWETMRQHPIIGEQILSGVPGFDGVARAVRHEHERWDGGGYPDGVSGEDIPLASRIVFTCDAFHAMTSDRPYRAAMPVADARAELNKHAGSQFDPTVVTAFDHIIENGTLDRALAAVDRRQHKQTAVAEVQDVPALAEAALERPTSIVEPATTSLSIEDPRAMAAISYVNAAMVAVLMAAYLAAERSFDLIGTSFVVAAATVALAGFALRNRTPRSWCLYTSLSAYVAVPILALHYDQPTMLTMMLGSALLLSAFFWSNPVLRIGQAVLLVFEFIALPVILFGGSAFTFAAVSARAFPGALLIVGYFAMRLTEMRFERERFTGTMSSLLRALQARDGYTADHSRETVAMAVLVAEELGLDEAACADLEDVALLHDIGKLGVPDEILNKPGKLDDEEWKIMRQHPVVGEQIVSRVPGFETVAIAIRHEHERWDGGGYPDGLSGEDIPFPSRIVFACDAFHAMTSDRPYRKSLGEEIARDEMIKHAGSQFDPAVVIALLHVLDKLQEPPIPIKRPQLAA